MVPEVIVQILRGLPDEMGVFQIPVQGVTVCCCGFGHGVFLVDPPGKAWFRSSGDRPVCPRAKELHPDGLEEPLDFSPTLGLVGFGMDEGDPQRRRRSQVMGSEGGTIVHVELSSEATLLRGRPQRRPREVSTFSFRKNPPWQTRRLMSSMKAKR